MLLVETQCEDRSIFTRVGFAGDVLEPQGSWNAADAEAMAIIAMSEFLLSRPANSALHIRCHYDAIGVGHGAFGMQQVPHSSSDLPMQARIMLSLVQRKFPDLKGYHVKAHSGHPWNEFADSLAFHVRKGWKCPVTPQLRSLQLRTHTLREWAWLEVAPDNCIPDIATILTNKESRADVVQPDKLFRKCQLETPQPPMRDNSVTFKIATANVGAMNYGQADGAMTWKTAELIQQFALAEYDIIGIQESRAKNDQTIQEGHFVRYISAGACGQAGVELWVNVARITSKMQSSFDPHKDVVVWHNDQRSLAARIACGAFTVDVLVLYAPQQGKGEDEIVQWWQSIRQILASHTRTCPIWVLGDMNAKIGSVSVEGIGPLAPDFEDVGGICFRELVQDFGLYVPSTMEEYHTGQTWTYCGTRGHHTRLDYIAVSDECVPGIHMSKIDNEIDLMNGDRDHCVVSLSLKAKVGPHIETLFERRNCYDRRAAGKHLHSGQHNPDFELPDVDWGTGIHEHWANIRDHFQHLAKKHFPKQARQQRQLYLSEKSWSLVCQRKDIKACFRHSKSALKLLTLRQCFQAWKGDNSEPLAYTDLQIHVLTMQQAMLYERQQQVDAAFRQCKKDDWRKWVEDRVANQLAQASEARGADVFRIFKPKKMIRKHSGANRVPLPGLQDALGNWQYTKHAQGLAWQNQFSTIENAVETTIEGLYAKSKPKYGQRSLKFLQDTPSLFALESAVRTLDINKAAGADGIGAELLKLHAPMNIQKMFAMMLKMSIRGQSTPEATGGWLIPLHKKGSQRQMQNYRAILLEPTLSRAMSRAWRPKLEQGVSNTCSPMQWGGRRGFGIEGIHLHVRLWQDNAAHKRESLGLAFIDLKSAFYSVIKPFLALEGYTPEAIADIFRMVALPHEAFAEFMQEVESADLVRKSLDTEAASEMVAATLAHTWFCIPGGDKVCAPQTGSRPGDPMADLLFAFIVAKMVDQVNANLESAHVAEVGNESLMLAPSVTWVDDMTFVIPSSADQLVDSTMRVMSEVISVFMLHGFQLSYGSGKTAIILDFKGKNAHSCRLQCEKRFPHSLPVLSELAGKIDVPLVSHYKHLGGFVTRGGSNNQEIQVRSQQATARMKPLRHLLKNPKIPLEQRRIVLKSMVLSVLSLHSATWTNMGQQAFQTWKGALFRCYAALHSRTQGEEVTHMSFEEAALAAACPMPLEYLHLQRLRLFRHFLQEGEVFMYSALVYNLFLGKTESWTAMVLRSLVWLQDQIGDLNLPAHVWELDSIDKWNRAKPFHTQLRKMIKHAAQAHQWRIKTSCAVRQSNSKQEAILREMGWTKAKDEAAVEPSAVPVVRCSKCDFTCTTHAALATHEQRKHGERIAVRRFAVDDICRICKKCFHSRVRLMLHLHYSKTKCWFKLFRRYEPMSVEQTQQLDEADVRHGTAFHQHGLRSREQDFACRKASQEECDRVLAKQDNDDDQLPTAEELESWRQWGLLPVGMGGRPATTRTQQDPTVPNVVEDLQQAEWSWLKELTQWQPHFDFVPRPFSTGTKYMLILFSGHRRHEDVACWLQWSSDVIPINVDLAVSMEHGNVLSPLWEQLIRSRRVIGCHAGPPCETFTEARWNKLPDKKAPRPLRDSAYPWGKIQRSLREVKQGPTGTVLFAHTAYILYLVYAYGGALTLEHPKGPDERPEPGQVGKKWSVWFSAFVRRLLLTHDARSICFLQGPLGQCSPKPTIFVEARLPHLAQALYAAYKPGWRPSARLGGFDYEANEWRTAKAKIYPGRLCQVLAAQYQWFAECIHEDGSELEPEGLQEALQELAMPWDSYQEDHDDAMAADYHPSVAGGIL